MLKILFIILFSFPAFAQLKSQFPSTVEGLDIPNTHLVIDGKGQVYRSNEPKGFEQQALDFGITHILIFKNQTKNEVDLEIEKFQELGMAKENLLHIPFRWKDLESEEQACEQIMDALEYIKSASEDSKSKLLFHCTVGEDRTGLLAGVTRMLYEGISAETAFYDEMCEKGYESGNSRKPANVVSAIRNELTPIFLKLAYFIESGELSWHELDREKCKEFKTLEARKNEWTCDQRD